MIYGDSIKSKNLQHVYEDDLETDSFLGKNLSPKYS